MGINTSSATIINNNGKLQNSPALTVSHPSASETVVTVGTPSGTPMNGTTYAYGFGGNHPTGPLVSAIDQLTFSSDTLSNNVGDLTEARETQGTQSKEHIYASGGASSSTVRIDTIDRFFGGSGITSVDCGNLIQAQGATQSTSSSSTKGFVNSGYMTPGGPTAQISSHTFSSSVTSADHGDLGLAVHEAGGHSSSTDGFVTLYTIPGTHHIQKFPFAVSGSTAVDIGDLSPSISPNQIQGHSSQTDGYASNYHGVNKFPFAISGGTATAHISPPAVSPNPLVAQTRFSGGTQNTDNGYGLGGYGTVPPTQNIISNVFKFPFASGASYTYLSLLTSPGTGYSSHDKGGGSW